MRIVVPRALHYHYLFPWWEAFFKALGHEVLVTPPTDRDILDRGVRAALSDICLPLKAFLGHVEVAGTMGGTLFVPRLVSRDPARYYCPKFLALPDIVRAKFPDREILSVEINAKKGEGYSRKSFRLLAAALGASGPSADRAMDAGEEAYRARRESEVRGFGEVFGAGDGAMKVALVGHPYTVEDAFLSSGLKDWVLARGARVVTTENVPADALERVETGLFRDIYWECAHSLTRAAFLFLGRGDLGGMILLSAFGCGPDSFISDIVGRRARSAASFPFVRLLLDEHTAREGLVTRLEAFMDMAHAFREKRGRESVLP